MQLLDLAGVPHDEIPDSMVAETVAGGPVGDIGINPVPEDGDVPGRVAVGEQRNPCGYDKSLLHHPRLVEFLAEREDLLFLAGPDLLPVLLRDRGYGCGLQAVAPDLLPEEPP